MQNIFLNSYNNYFTVVIKIKQYHFICILSSLICYMLSRQCLKIIIISLNKRNFHSFNFKQFVRILKHCIMALLNLFAKAQTTQPADSFLSVTPILIDKVDWQKIIDTVNHSMMGQHIIHSKTSLKDPNS